MNEETILENYSIVNESDAMASTTDQTKPWKYIVLGGVPGILMGAGLMCAGQTTAHSDEASLQGELPQDESEGNSLQVASVDEELTFGQAFAAARAAVGPGGVFEWRGGLYNTYTQDEWSAMTAEQKNAFAQQVNPITPVENIQVPTDAYTHVVVVHDIQQTTTSPVESRVHEATAPPEDVQIVEQRIAQNFDMGEDVHIVGYANAQGHLVVGYDTDGDGQADVAIIDMDDSGTPSDLDIILDTEGNMAHLGDLADDPDPYQTASMDDDTLTEDMNNDIPLIDL